MNWKAKAKLQKMLDALPGSAAINYFFQRYVARNLPVGKDLFMEKVNDAHLHFKHFLEFGPQQPIEETRAYEFGAGWDLIGPLTYYFLGIRNQKVIDLKPHVRFELIGNSLKRFIEYAPGLEKRFDLDPDDLGNQAQQVKNIEQLKRHFGIDYRAPSDAGKTGMSGQSFDLITSTNTFEHIPANEIPLILDECRRLLQPEGALCCRIDYQDHYAYFDSHISLYNFLQFSDEEWKAYNHSVQFQNRLRHGDYLQLFKQAGLQVVHQVAYRVEDADRAVLANLSLAPKFENRSETDLMTRWCCFVLKT